MSQRATKLLSWGGGGLILLEMLFSTQPVSVTPVVCEPHSWWGSGDLWNARDTATCKVCALPSLSLWPSNLQLGVPNRLSSQWSKNEHYVERLPQCGHFSHIPSQLTQTRRLRLLCLLQGWVHAWYSHLLFSAPEVRLKHKWVVGNVQFYCDWNCWGINRFPLSSN